jgi:hypothetical protein
MIRKAALGVVILWSVALVGGCTPAWHPSGKSVCFPYFDEKSQTSGLAIYELEGKEARRIVEEPGDEGLLGSGWYLWTGDGKAILCATPDGPDRTKGLRITKLDPKSGRLDKIAAVADSSSITIYPPVTVKDRYLWVSLGREKEGDKGGFCARIDLTNGHVEKFLDSDKEMVLLVGDGKRGCVYVRLDQADNKKEDPQADLEFGLFDTETGKCEAHGTIKRGPVTFPVLVAEPGGKRFAQVMDDGERKTMEMRNDKGEVRQSLKLPGEKRVVRLLDEKGAILGTLKLPDGIVHVGRLTWAGGVIWARAMELGKEPKAGGFEKKLGLLKVDVQSGQSRFISLTTEKVAVRAESGGENLSMMSGPSISPDGKLLAITMDSSSASAGPKASVLLIFETSDSDKAPSEIKLAPSIRKLGDLPR